MGPSDIQKISSRYNRKASMDYSMEEMDLDFSSDQTKSIEGKNQVDLYR